MDENKIIITVSGADKVGIVASITAVLAKVKVNIEDIKQTLMQGHFVMFMLCDIENSNKSFSDFQNLLKEELRELGMEVWIQRKEIFDCMHNIG